MSGLFGLLDLGANAYLAHTAGAATAGRNIANASTEGYSRERIDLRALDASPLVGGVRALGPLRAESPLLAARERTSAGAQGHTDSLATALSDVEMAVSPPGGTDLVDHFATLFAGISALSAAPLDGSLRTQAVGSAGDLAAAFQRASRAIQTSRGGADARLKDHAARATELAAQIAKVNQQMVTSKDPVLADQRETAAKQLAELTGAQARVDPDGMMRITIDGGATVVDGTHASSFEAVGDPAYDGHVRMDLVAGNHRDNITERMSGGRMGGEVAFRDGTMKQMATDVDQLAYDTATRINQVHAASAGLDGVSGRDLYVAPTTVAGAAAAMAVNPDIVADPNKLAGAAAGQAAGDNSGFLALAGLADQPGANGRTFIADGIRVLSNLGGETRRAQASRDLEAAGAEALAATRDSVSGVSTEEEMAKLSEFQRASQAATKFISTVDDMLRGLLESL